MASSSAAVSSSVKAASSRSLLALPGRPAKRAASDNGVSGESPAKRLRSAKPEEQVVENSDDDSLFGDEQEEQNESGDDDLYNDSLFGDETEGPSKAEEHHEVQYDDLSSNSRLFGSGYSIMDALNEELSTGNAFDWPEERSDTPSLLSDSSPTIPSNSSVSSWSPPPVPPSPETPATLVAQPSKPRHTLLLPPKPRHTLFLPPKPAQPALTPQPTSATPVLSSVREAEPPVCRVPAILQAATGEPETSEQRIAARFAEDRVTQARIKAANEEFDRAEAASAARDAARDAAGAEAAAAVAALLCNRPEAIARSEAFMKSQIPHREALRGDDGLTVTQRKRRAKKEREKVSRAARAAEEAARPPVWGVDDEYKELDDFVDLVQKSKRIAAKRRQKEAEKEKEKEVEKEELQVVGSREYIVLDD